MDNLCPSITESSGENFANENRKNGIKNKHTYSTN